MTSIGRSASSRQAPQHKVILTQPIYLGVNEVTQAEYEKVMGKNPSHFAPMGMGKEAVAGMETADHPVEMVSWNDAAEFCAKLSQTARSSNRSTSGPVRRSRHSMARVTVCPAKRNGNSLAAQGPPRSTGSATRTKTWCGRGGSAGTRAGGRTRRVS